MAIVQESGVCRTSEILIERTRIGDQRLQRYNIRSRCGGKAATGILPPPPARVITNVLSLSLTDGAPGHRDQDSALHALDQRNRLVHRLCPTLNAP